MPTVSVCIPTYNRKDYLKETLESVFAQTYNDYEIVIVDDGSTDGTEEMIQHINFPIRYYWQENAGDAAARNKLIELAKGKYITFIDSDDLLMPDALQRMTDVLTSRDEDVIVYGGYLAIDESGNIAKRRKRKLYSGCVTKHLFQDVFIHSCGSMFPKHIFDADTALDTTLKVCSDYDLWLRLSLRYEFVALADPVFKRRRHSSNLSARSFKSRLTELNVLERFYYEKGGDRVIPRRLAMRRLSKEAYRVGKSALAEGNLKAVQKYFEKSLQYSFNLKSMFFLKRNKWTC